MSSAATSDSTESLLNSIDAVACFGRLADKAFVLPQNNVEGTAASGYEFGVLEAGRPKWMCTYFVRIGKTQGGGNTMTHVPNWRSRLFEIDDSGDELLQNRAALKKVLFSEEIKVRAVFAPSTLDSFFHSLYSQQKTIFILSLWLVPNAPRSTWRNLCCKRTLEQRSRRGCHVDTPRWGK